MVLWKEIGNYLGRKILFAQGNSLNQIKFPFGMADSTVVLFCGYIFDEAEIKKIFAGLKALEPIAVGITGRNTDRNFGLLLEVLSVNPTENHIMTYVYQESENFEWLDSFVKNGWPSEERHDFWKKCLVLFIGDESVGTRLEAYIQKNFSVENQSV